LEEQVERVREEPGTIYTAKGKLNGDALVGYVSQLELYIERKHDEYAVGMTQLLDCLVGLEAKGLAEREAARAEGRREAATVRPPRSKGNPPEGNWGGRRGGDYALGWGDAVAAYVEAILE
jgi:hypothetical protein